MNNEDNNLEILVVDDEEIVRSSIARAVKRMGYKVDSASCTEEALKLIKKKKYEIYISDLKMPGEDGVVLLEKTQSLHKDIYFILITGYISQLTEKELIGKGAFALLEKPVFVKDLRELIEKCRKHKKLKNEN